MYLNSLGGTNGYYYPGMFDSGNRARNKHVGGFGDDEASAGNINAANQNTAANSANANNVTQYAPPATSAAQQAGSATDASPSSVNGQQQVSGPSSTQSTIGSEFAPEQNILTSVIGASLEALGLVSPSDLANTNISFDSLSYGVESSVSAAAGVQGQQVGAEVDESQSAELQGQGQITLANGTVYDFQVQLQVGDELQASGSQTLGGSSNSSDSSNPLAGLSNLGSDGTQGAQGAQAASGASDGSSGSSDISSNYLAQLVNAMEQSASQAYASDPNSFLQQATPSASSGAQGVSSATPASSSGSASAQPTINWDAIQKQTSSLIDMLDAMISANQSAGSGTSTTAANASTTGAAAQSNTTSSNNATVAAAA